MALLVAHAKAIGCDFFDVGNTSKVADCKRGCRKEKILFYGTIPNQYLMKCRPRRLAFYNRLVIRINCDNSVPLRIVVNHYSSSVLC